MEVKKTVQILEGKHWRTTFETIDEKTVFRSLSGDVIAKKINQCSYIKSIKREQHYTHVSIIVRYNHDTRHETRAVYTLPAMGF